MHEYISKKKRWGKGGGGGLGEGEVRGACGRKIAKVVRLLWGKRMLLVASPKTYYFRPY